MTLCLGAALAGNPSGLAARGNQPGEEWMVTANTPGHPGGRLVVGLRSELENAESGASR